MMMIYTLLIKCLYAENLGSNSCFWFLCIYLYTCFLAVFIYLHLSFGTQCCLRKKRANRDTTLPEWVAYKQAKQRRSKRRGPYSTSLLSNRWGWHSLTFRVDTWSYLIEDWLLRQDLFLPSLSLSLTSHLKVCSSFCQPLACSLSS